jgi:hypothetical protein
MSSRAARFLLLMMGLSACGGRPAEVLPPMAMPVLAEAPSDFPKLKLGDGTETVNDRCPVTKRKLSAHFPPVYVNGQSIGFC